MMAAGLTLDEIGRATRRYEHRLEDLGAAYGEVRAQLGPGRRRTPAAGGRAGAGAGRARGARGAREGGRSDRAATPVARRSEEWA